MRHPILAEAIALIDHALKSKIYPSETVHILQKRRAQLERRTKDDRIFVAFIGEKKAGKTALVRALTQVPLPTAIRECTAAVCEIQVGKALHHHAHFTDGNEQAFEAIDDSEHHQKLQNQKSKDSEAAKAAAQQIIEAEQKKKDTESKLSEHHNEVLELEHQIGVNQRELRSARGAQPWLLPWIKPFKWLSSGLSDRLDTIERIETELNEARQGHAEQKEQLEELVTLRDAQEDDLQRKWAYARNQAAKYSQAIQDTQIEIETIHTQNAHRFEGDLSELIDVQKTPAERIQIQSPNLDIPDELVILDTPGLNTDRPNHRRRAWSAIEELADVCILVSDLRQPMPDTLMDMLDRLIPYCPNLHVALTKKDLARRDAEGLSDSPDTEVAEAIIMAKARIADRWPHPLQVWSVASIHPPDQEDVRTKFKTFWDKLSPNLRVQKHALLASAVLAEIADLLTPQITDTQTQLSKLKAEQGRLEAEAIQSNSDNCTNVEDTITPLLTQLRLDMKNQIFAPEDAWVKKMDTAISKSDIEACLKDLNTKMSVHMQELEGWLKAELKNGIQRQVGTLWKGENPLNETELIRLNQDIQSTVSESNQSDSKLVWLWEESNAASLEVSSSGDNASLHPFDAGSEELKSHLEKSLEETKQKSKTALTAALNQLEEELLERINDIEKPLNAQLIALLNAATRESFKSQLELLTQPHKDKKKRLMSFQRQLWKVRTRFLQTSSDQTNPANGALPRQAKEAKQ